VGINAASTVWLFAGGESSADRQTFFTILNPTAAAPAAVTATYFDHHGTPIGSQTIVVDPLHRGNIKLNDVLPSARVATILTSNVPVVIERPMYEGTPNLGLARSGSVVFGRNGGALTWSFPDGSTANGDQTRLYLFNPGLKANQVQATFYGRSGAPLTQSYTLAPDSDTVIAANTVPGLPAGHFGVVLKSVGGQVIVAEMGTINPITQRATSVQGVAQ
jgi:hypothetical protein